VNVLVSALVSAVVAGFVTVIIEWLLRPHLELRKELLMRRDVARRDLIQFAHRESDGKESVSVDSVYSKEQYLDKRQQAYERLTWDFGPTRNKAERAAIAVMSYLVKEDPTDSESAPAHRITWGAAGMALSFARSSANRAYLRILKECIEDDNIPSITKVLLLR
jgi:hypothetical protein